MAVIFEEWMSRVNIVIESTVALDSRDMIDQPYHDWYDEGMPPLDAAMSALENCGWDGPIEERE